MHSYRPTGPQLLSPSDIAEVPGKVLGRNVEYQDASMKMFAEAAKALGFPDFEIPQIRYYAEELRNGAYEIGGPTDHVELVTGRKPESFIEERSGMRTTTVVLATDDSASFWPLSA